jgi:hypothetical protein
MGVYRFPPQPTQLVRAAPANKTKVYGDNPPVVVGLENSSLLPAVITPYFYPRNVPQQYFTRMDPWLYGVPPPPPIDPDDVWGDLECDAPFPTAFVGAGAILISDAPHSTMNAEVYPVGYMIANAPVAYMEGRTGLNSWLRTNAPVARGVGFTGALLREDSPEAVIYSLAHSSKITLTATAVFPFMVATGNTGILGELDVVRVIGELSATAYIVPKGIATMVAPFPTIVAHGSFPHNFENYILHNMEYGYVGKVTMYDTSPVATATGGGH